MSYLVHFPGRVSGAVVHDLQAPGVNTVQALLAEGVSHFFQSPPPRATQTVHGSLVLYLVEQLAPARIARKSPSFSSDGAAELITESVVADALQTITSTAEQKNRRIVVLLIKFCSHETIETRQGRT